MKTKSEIKRHLLLIVLSLFLSSVSCKEDPLIPKQQAKLTLAVDEVSCTEVWINLTTTNLQLPTTLNLLRDDNIFRTINLQTADTLLYIDSLLPNQTYNFKSVIQSINHSSNEVSVVTMDTTSHNFTWQTIEFGQNNSSTLYDVTIIDENNIWAVGEIYLNDSLGNPDPSAYNAVHWDGNEWKLYKLQFYTFCGQTHTGSYPANSIFAINNTELFISSGSQITQIIGTTQIKTECIPVSVFKIWGSDENNLYAVGVNGQVAHYTNSQWRRIESGTSTNIQDVWGCLNSKNEMIVYCAVSNVFTPGDYKILTIDKNNIVDSVSWNTGRRVGTIWTPNGKLLYTGGGGVFNNKSGIWKEETSLPLYYTNRIRGNSLNDILVVGDFGLVSHFNGMNWNIYQEFMQGTTPSFYSIAIKENLVVLSGLKGSKAIVAIGKRN